MNFPNLTFSLTFHKKISPNFTIQLKFLHTHVHARTGDITHKQKFVKFSRACFSRFVEFFLHTHTYVHTKDTQLLSLYRHTHTHTLHIGKQKLNENIYVKNLFGTAMLIIMSLSIRLYGEEINKKNSTIKCKKIQNTCNVLNFPLKIKQEKIIKTKTKDMFVCKK